MMSMITSAYTASVSSFFNAKFQRHIEEILVSPIPNYLILLGYMSGGILRGFLVGLAVTMITLFFTTFHIYSLGIILCVGFLSSCIFSLGGLINAIFAEKFDDIAFIPTFILTPLTYLGGVFYSIALLPPIWQYISFANPIVYIVNAFRYGFLGTPDPLLLQAFIMMLVFVLVLFSVALLLLVKSVRLRN
jgi:ABC-2 type transport system permease protein